MRPRPQQRNSRGLLAQGIYDGICEQPPQTRYGPYSGFQVGDQPTQATSAPEKGCRHSLFNTNENGLKQRPTAAPDVFNSLLGEQPFERFIFGL